MTDQNSTDASCEKCIWYQKEKSCERGYHAGTDPSQCPEYNTDVWDYPMCSPYLRMKRKKEAPR